MCWILIGHIILTHTSYDFISVGSLEALFQVHNSEFDPGLLESSKFPTWQCLPQAWGNGPNEVRIGHQQSCLTKMDSGRRVRCVHYLDISPFITIKILFKSNLIIIELQKMFSYS